MESLFVDKTIVKKEGFKDGKFNSLSKINTYRTTTERHYNTLKNNNNNNDEITLEGIDNVSMKLYRTAVDAKSKSVCILYFLYFFES